jgi:hypothetical protein
MVRLAFALEKGPYASQAGIMSGNRAFVERRVAQAQARHPIMRLQQTTGNPGSRSLAAGQARYQPAGRQIRARGGTGSRKGDADGGV